MDVLGGARHVVPYLDMPLQHIADPILTSMKRGKGGPATWELVRRLRATVPNLTLRTTFITGLPGETQRDFDELVEFVRELRFERMGVFTFSVEEDTPAATMADQVPAELAAERRDQLMELQREISREQHEAMIGKELEVIVEGVSEESELLLQGRHKGQAPEIDGLTYITGGTAAPGDVVTILVDQAGDYDVAGEIVAPARHKSSGVQPEAR
jgi:ribosomal protein S12 methylthiotransferase